MKKCRKCPTILDGGYTERRGECSSCRSARRREVRKSNVLLRLKDNVFNYNKKLIKAVPYSLTELKEHIENQFEPWMNWDNWGPAQKVPRKAWHIDHIIPKNELPYSSFKSNNFKKLWALENLRPLDAYENIRKDITYRFVELENMNLRCQEKSKQTTCTRICAEEYMLICL